MYYEETSTGRCMLRVLCMGLKLIDAYGSVRADLHPAFIPWPAPRQRQLVRTEYVLLHQKKIYNSFHRGERSVLQDQDSKIDNVPA